jgi:hypothetical protein
MVEEPSEVFRGSLEECLTHLAEDIGKRAKPQSRDIVIERMLIATFCSVGETRVQAWLKLEELPRGERFCKLLCYLMIMGYRVAEFELGGTPFLRQ